MQFNPSCLAFSISTFMITSTYAQIEGNSKNDLTLPIMSFQANSKDAAFVGHTAKAVLRSDVPLFETAQSMSVMTKKQIEQKQAKTVAEALEGVAGVTSGQYGRRGWDDFIIRGQISSSQIYIDGLRIQTSTNVLRAEDLFGLESIEVVKGPTSVGFGLALPGGLVNLTTKRPQNKSFRKAQFSYGSHDFKEGTFDINYAPENNEKGAFRILGKISDKDDFTDHIYFKNKYFASSYNFNLDEKNDLSVIASYQDYRYMRQQGIPHENNLNHQSYNRSLFFGEPNYGYNTNTYRIGLNYTHYFNHDWILNQNFALTKTDLIANPVLAFGRSHLPIIKRAINYQDKQDINYTLDTNIQRKFKLNNVNYDLMIGMDLMRERSNYYRRIDVINPFHANHLDYGITRVREGRPNREKIYNQYAGLYLRNTINIGDNWLIGLSGRHDWTQVEVNHAIQNTRLKNSDHAFTGSASVMYRLHDMFAPYISYSTSFKPVTDTGEQGQILNPERGEQIEVGMKFQALDQQLQGYLAYYDLVRKNVTESDISRGYSIQTGKQVTQGLEAEVAASLSDQWNILATYSFIPTAKIIQSRREDEIGQRINHVPRHAGMLSTQYYFSADQLQLGWNIGAGIRYQGARVAKRSRDSIYLPHYVLFDVHVGYDTEDWGMGLGIKNLFDKNYLVGTTPNAQLVNWGDPRMIRFNVKLNF